MKAFSGMKIDDRKKVVVFLSFCFESCHFLSNNELA